MYRIHIFHNKPDFIKVTFPYCTILVSKIKSDKTTEIYTHVSTLFKNYIRSLKPANTKTLKSGLA